MEVELVPEAADSVASAAAAGLAGVIGDARGVGVVEPSAANPGAGLGRLGADPLLGSVLRVPKSSLTNSSEDRLG